LGVNAEGEWIDNGYITNIRSQYLSVANTANIFDLNATHIDCKDINPPVAIDNLEYNINIGSINNIAISEYLKGATTFSRIFTKDDVLTITENSKIGLCQCNFKIDAKTNALGDALTSLTISFINNKDIYMYAKDQYGSNRTSWYDLFSMDITSVLKGLIGTDLYNSAIPLLQPHNLILGSGSEGGSDSNNPCGRNVDHANRVDDDGQLLIQFSTNASNDLTLTCAGNWNGSTNDDNRVWGKDGSNYNDTTGSLILIQ